MKEGKEFAAHAGESFDKPIAKETLKPFPYYPSPIPEAEMKRMEVMMELNKWANNDPFMAKRAAETLVLLIAEQFNISLIKLDQ
jgi:hypothetical protein